MDLQDTADHSAVSKHVIVVVIPLAVGGGPHQNMPPTRICNFIMRIL
jgi:hypothetical protein